MSKVAAQKPERESCTCGAAVVKAEGASVDEDTIKTYVRDHLARYKVPREVVFLDELPRNPTGKVLKRELRDMAVGGDDEKAQVGGDDEKAQVGGDDEKAQVE